MPSNEPLPEGYALVRLIDPALFTWAKTRNIMKFGVKFAAGVWNEIPVDAAKVLEETKQLRSNFPMFNVAYTREEAEAFDRKEVSPRLASGARTVLRDQFRGLDGRDDAAFEAEVQRRLKARQEEAIEAEVQRRLALEEAKREAAELDAELDVEEARGPRVTAVTPESDEVTAADKSEDKQAKKAASKRSKRGSKRKSDSTSAAEA
jgi:hypothetical protein